MVYFGIMPFPYSAQLILKSKAHPCYLMCWDEENLGSVEGPAKKLLTKKLLTNILGIRIVIKDGMMSKQ